MLDDTLDPLIDPLIDDVAREMTSAPPRDGLARRVAMRIAEGGERRSWWRLWILVPVASVCVLLAVFVSRQGSVRLKPDTTRAVQPTQTAAAAAIVGRPFQGRQGGAESPAPQGQRPEPARQAPTLPPIEVERLEVQPMGEMTAINISPIAIDRIEISAMP